MNEHKLPLDGIRVLDFTHVLAGPFCTYQLAVMGADVIKIESADRADMMRFNGPDFTLAEQNMGLHYQTQASNKRALSLDLKHPDAMDVLKALIADADVLVVNYRKSAAEKLSIDYNSARQINPDIIYCSLTGYGQTGPKADHPAYDNVIQAFSGLMAATGTEEHGPVRVGPPVLDYGTGAQAAMAVVSSLYQRERTGEGNFIDIAMLDSALMLMSASVTDTALTGNAPRRPGNRSVRASYGCYKTKDGDIMLGAYTQQQMVSLWNTLGCPEKAVEVEQLSSLQLDDAYDEDTTILTDVLLQRCADEWEQLLNEANVPAARVRTLNETLKEPHLQSRSVIQNVEITNQASTSLGTHLTVPVAAWQARHGSPRANTAPPAVGEHTIEILREIGFDNEQIESLCRSGGATHST